MGRIRTIKPDFFQHEELYDLEAETGLPVRVAFAGLWTQCDREGRFEWRPRKLKANVLPYDEAEFSRVLDALTTRGFVVKYHVDGVDYGWIPGFSEHQVVNNRESESKLPEPNENNILTRAGRVPDACHKEGKGMEGNKEGKGMDTALSPPASTPPGNGAAVITLPLNDKSEHAITEHDLERWAELYPAVDVHQQLRNMRGWLDSNPAKRKTKRGIERFVTNWLSRDQDRGGTKQTRGYGVAPPVDNSGAAEEAKRRHRERMQNAGE